MGISSTIGSRDVGSAALTGGPGGSLSPMSVDAIPAGHPVRVIATVYDRLHEGCEGQHLPDFATLLKSMDRELIEYCLVLSPVAAEPFIDFLVMRRGTRIPDAELADTQLGERYSHHILRERLDERLLELASCLALKQSRLTAAMSARPSMLNVKVFRAVFPVWDQSLLQHVVLLAVAPVYAMVASQP